MGSKINYKGKLLDKWIVCWGRCNYKEEIQKLPNSLITSVHLLNHYVLRSNVIASRAIERGHGHAIYVVFLLLEKINIEHVGLLHLL